MKVHQPTLFTVGQLVFLILATYLGNRESKSFFETIFWLRSTRPQYFVVTIQRGVSSAKFFLPLLSSGRMGGTAAYDKFYFEITYLSDPSPIITLPCLSLSSKLKFGQDIKVEFAHLSRPWSIGWVALSFLFRLSSCYGDTRPNLHFFQYIQA